MTTSPLALAESATPSRSNLELATGKIPGAHHPLEEDESSACAVSERKRASAFAREAACLQNAEKVMRAYKSALEAFNSENWDASVSLCGKTLENIARSELGFTEQSGNLAQLMEKLIHHINTDQPFIDMATALKSGGGLGSHFNLESENNQETAAVTLDVIECFISYNYVFGAKLRHLLDLVRPGEDEVIQVKMPPADGRMHGNGTNGADHGAGSGPDSLPRQRGSNGAGHTPRVMGESSGQSRPSLFDD